MWAGLITAAAAGVLATTDDGRRVVLEDDGTWEEVRAEPGDCGALLRDEVEPVTGAALAAAAPVRLPGPLSTALELSLFGDPVAHTVTWTLVADGVRPACVEADSALEVRFADGGELALVNGLPINCEGTFAVAMTRDHEKLAGLATRNISALRLWLRDTSVQVAVPPEEAARLRQVFACLRGL